MNDILQKVEDIISIINCRKCLLVAGDSFDKLGLDSIFSQIRFVRYRDFTPNPIYEQVYEGVELFNKEACEAIIAVGGGSAIDVAKCIKLFCKLDKTKNYLQQEYQNNSVLLIAIPTTAGTGSEATKYAVIYHNGVKQSITHQCILPDFVVLESSLLRSLPLYQKKSTLLDSLCQAIESWWSVNSTDESVGYSKMTISIIKNYWKQYLWGDDIFVAKLILEASNYSGKAINITATTAAHAMSYKMTSMYHISHGHAVAISMPFLWKYISDHLDRCIDKRGKAWIENMMNDLELLLDYHEFCEILNGMELDYPIAYFREKELDILVKDVNLERLGNFPVLLPEDEIRIIYGRVLQ